MSKVAIVYWSGTGNTEAMANAVADGVQEKGSEAVLLGPSARPFRFLRRCGGGV